MLHKNEYYQDFTFNHFKSELTLLIHFLSDSDNIEVDRVTPSATSVYTIKVIKSFMRYMKLEK